jgi:hypothetical protein
MSERRTGVGAGNTYQIEERTDRADTIKVDAEHCFSVADLRVTDSGELYAGAFPIKHAIKAGMIAAEEIAKFQRTDAKPAPSRLRILCGLERDPKLEAAAKRLGFDW